MKKANCGRCGNRSPLNKPNENRYTCYKHGWKVTKKQMCEDFKVDLKLTSKFR